MSTEGQQHYQRLLGKVAESIVSDGIWEGPLYFFAIWLLAAAAGPQIYQDNETLQSLYITGWLFAPFVYLVARHYLRNKPRVKSKLWVFLRTWIVSSVLVIIVSLGLLGKEKKYFELVLVLALVLAFLSSIGYTYYYFRKPKTQ